MLFHPAKVPLKVISILFKVYSAHCAAIAAGQGAIHILRNAVGVGGWSFKALLLESLLRYVINKMMAKALPQVDGWSKNCKNLST